MGGNYFIQVAARRGAEMSENDEKLAQFQSITGCDQERAQFYLESANWQIDLAMASFYEGEGDMEVGGDQAPAAAAPAPVSAPQLQKYQSPQLQLLEVLAGSTLEVLS